jgi:hypothetical protein
MKVFLEKKKKVCPKEKKEPTDDTSKDVYSQ